MNTTVAQTERVDVLGRKLLVAAGQSTLTGRARNAYVAACKDTASCRPAGLHPVRITTGGIKSLPIKGDVALDFEEGFTVLVATFSKPRPWVLYSMEDRLRLSPTFLPFGQLLALLQPTDTIVIGDPYLTMYEQQYGDLLSVTGDRKARKSPYGDRWQTAPSHYAEAFTGYEEPCVAVRWTDCSLEVFRKDLKPQPVIPTQADDEEFAPAILGFSCDGLDDPTAI